MSKETLLQKEHYAEEDLRELIALLRAPGGCPWDQAQTHQSVRRGVIEEAYEVAEAIDRDQPEMLVEELGDLLMQVYFHAQIGLEEGRFTLQDVYDCICKKLIFRHPHIFAGAPDASGSTEEGWQALKRREKGHQSLKEELEAIAKTLPALTRAEKIAGRKYREDKPETLLRQLSEEAAALRSRQDPAAALGSLLFLIARLCRALSVDPEDALTRQNEHETGTAL